MRMSVDFLKIQTEYQIQEKFPDFRICARINIFHWEKNLQLGADRFRLKILFRNQYKKKALS